MSFARATALITTLFLAACGSTAAEPSTAVASPGAFAPPRHPDRAADPLSPGPAGQAELRLGAPFIQDAEVPGVPLPREQPGALAELEHNAGHLQRCWQRRAGAARSGRIVIHAHLGADGLVQGQCITEDTIGDAELRQCANDLIAMGRYPALGAGTVDVVFPLHFGEEAG
jgi:hypothetical protein